MDGRTPSSEAETCCGPETGGDGADKVTDLVPMGTESRVVVAAQGSTGNQGKEAGKYDYLAGSKPRA